jgi:hypothetical protein
LFDVNDSKEGGNRDEVIMTASLKTTAYRLGGYEKKRPDVSGVADQYVRTAEKRFQEFDAKNETPASIPPTICFSRKIGAGALEIAGALAAKLGIRLADRLIIEHIAATRELSEKTIRLFDERYPGKIAELSAFLFGEKSFVMSNYVRTLFGSICNLAESEPTIFVGRGAHLVLPRDRVLAVRLICSKSYRINRLAKMYNLSYAEAEKKLDEVDEEQRSFFKKVFKRKDASPYEFDLVLNMDFIQNPGWAVEIVHTAFRTKFKTEQ